VILGRALPYGFFFDKWAENETDFLLAVASLNWAANANQSYRKFPKRIYIGIPADANDAAAGGICALTGFAAPGSRLHTLEGKKVMNEIDLQSWRERSGYSGSRHDR
jgi:hypothetical protein